MASKTRHGGWSPSVARKATNGTMKCCLVNYTLENLHGTQKWRFGR